MGKVGKYIIYLIIIFVGLFALNFFQVIDLPWLDPPSFEAKEKGAKQAKDMADKLE